MGSTYGNISIKGPSLAAAAEWLKAKSISALVGPIDGDWLTFTDERSDGQEFKWIRTILTAMSQDLDCIAVSVNVYDEEDLVLLIANQGEILVRYQLCPGMTMDEPTSADMAPKLENGQAFLDLFEISMSEDELKELLHVGMADFFYVFDAHEVIAGLLGMPKYGIGFGYNYAKQGEWDEAGGELLPIP